MVPLLVRGLIFLGAVALGLLAAGWLLADGFRLSVSGLVLALVVFALVQTVLAPFIAKMAARFAPAFLGGIGRSLDLSNITFVEGRRRVVGGDRRCSVRAVARPPRRPVGHRRRLHPQPCRPLRRRARRGRSGRRRRRRRPGHRTRRVHGARRRGERLRRDGDGPPGGLHVRRGPGPQSRRPGGQRPGADDLHRDRHPDRAHARDHRDGAGAHRRRRAHRVPARARLGGPGRDALPVPAAAGAVHGGERHCRSSGTCTPTCTTRCCG